MAKYGGFFLKGLATGLQGLGTQIGEMKWQKKENERIQKEKDDLAESVSIFNKKIEDYYADGTLSDDEKLQLNTAYLASAYNVQEVIKGSYDAVMKMDKDTVENNLAYLKSYRESWGDLDFDLSTIPEIYDYYKGQMVGEKGKQMFIAGDSLLKKQYEAKQEVVPEKPKIGDYGTGLTYLKNIINVSPENWETAKKGLENKFGFDYSAITQEALREVGSEVYNLYNTPEEVMSNVKAPAGLTIVPERDSKTGKYYAKFSKETAPTPTPEGEITAGEKRSWDMASSVMFGSSDWVTGISKPGIISSMVSSKLNMGQPLTEEEKTEVRNNYNTIKETLPDEIKNIIESQLQRYGISLEAPAPAPIAPTPEPQPGVIQKGIDKVKGWLGMEGIPKAGEIPTPKVSTEGKEALIPTMTNDELYNALKGLDPSDPIYKALYDEAVKRGLIEK